MSDTFAESGPQDSSEEILLYPPDGNALTAIVLYLLNNKKLPAVLPKDVCSPQNMETLLKHLIPLETFCTVCPGKIPLSKPILITQEATIVTFSGILEGVYNLGIHCFLIFTWPSVIKVLYFFFIYFLYIYILFIS